MDMHTYTCDRLGETYTELHHPSGLTILLSPKDFSTYHASLSVAYGSADRCIGSTAPMGIAHFLEHKMFEREGGSYDDDFSTLGAEVNAYTTYDRTAYLVSCTEHFSAALELLLRMTATLSVSRESVARERGIIAEEIRMNTDDPWEVGYAEMLRGLYRCHPVREEICGSEASIRRITPRVLEKTFDTFYRPERMVLSVCGRVTLEEVLAVVDQVWPVATEPRSRSVAPHVREPAYVHKSRVELRLSLPKPLFCIGIKLPGVPSGAPEQLRMDLSMTVLAEMLFSHSGDFYSELFESGIVTPGVSYGSSLGEGYGYFSLAGECDDPDMVYAAFEAYIARLHESGLDRREFDRARRILYADYVTGFDSTEDVAASLGGYALDSLRAGGHIGLYDFLAVAEQLTFEEISRLFRAAFCENQYTLTAILPSDR